MNIPKKIHRPPRLAKLLLQMFIRSESRNYAIGDFVEVFQEVCNNYGRASGYFWFWGQTFKSFFPFIFHSCYWGVIMFKNYFKVTIRGFLKNKAFTFINVIGLAIGFSCCLLIFLWVQDELGYESAVKNKENVYRLINEVEFAGQQSMLAKTPAPLAVALKNDFPEIIRSSRFWPFNFSLVYEHNEFQDLGALVDSDFIEMFSLKIIKGNPDKLLDGPRDLIISKSTADKIFGNVDPLGKTLRFDDIDMNVTGVFEDYPHNSHLQFKALSSMELIFSLGFPRDIWANFNNPIYSYVELSAEADFTQINSKIENIIPSHAENVKGRTILQPLTKIHLYSNFTGDVSGHGNIEYVYIAIIMGIFILLIACFNFMNLSTAKASGRAKEVGIRKVIGAFRKDLISQFLGEAFLLTLFAFAMAVTAVYFILPEFNQLLVKFIEIDFVNNSLLLWGSLGIVFLTGIIAGSYPAFMMSAFKPVSVLKGKITSGISGSSLRKVLVIIQFTLSVAISSGMVIMYMQTSYIQNKWLGFDKSHLVYFPIYDSMYKNLESFKTELQQYPGVKNTSLASHLLTDVTHVMGNVDWEGKDPSVQYNVNCLLVDENFVKTLGMKINEGRDFEGKYNGEDIFSIIVNETAAKKMNLPDIIGREIKWGERKGTIIGVVEDFHFKPLQNLIEPMILIKSDQESLVLYAKVDSHNIQETLAGIGNTWEKFYPDNDYNPRFVDNAINEMYGNEKRVQNLFEYFTILAVVISCMGLFGLASYMAEKRTKEIGIRKTLGASVTGVIYMLSKEFTIWILIANVIACPLSYIFMQKWLQGFAYRIEIPLFIFLGIGLGAFLITWITMGFQTIKAARANPIDSLKCE